jgi:hypothetical protein
MWASGRGLAPGNREFLGPDRQVPFGAPYETPFQPVKITLGLLYIIRPIVTYAT